jgi:hypothetical protein
MNMPIVLAFGHRSRSGKDEACRTIIQYRHSQPIMAEDPTIVWNIKHYSFARALKAEVTAAAFACGGMDRLFVRPQEYVQENGNFLELPEWVQMDLNPPMDDPDSPLGKQRNLLMWWGTEFRRSVNQDYWVKKVEAQIQEDKPDVALVSDLRFPNEKLWVQRYGMAVKINRPGLPHSTHESEIALAGVSDDQWDDVIQNKGTLAEFREKVLFSFDMLLSSTPEQKASV